MKFKFIIFLIIAPLFGAALAGAHLYYKISVWEYSGPDITLDIKSGDSFSKINARLKNKEVISSAKVFHRYCQLKKIMTKFKSGQFKIKKGFTMLEVIDTLIEGRSITVKVTIPEGKNLFEIGKILEKKGITSYDKYITLAKSQDLARKLNIPGDTVEGYLYPETYLFTRGTPALEVLKAMVNQFRKKIKKVDISKAPFDLHSIVTLASIVEKETGAKHERAKIAGVFHNRLKKNMRLQSDPTTIYGVYETFGGNLRRSHLQQKTPYNTYRINGLPKGPISNPGLQSIKAVINPDNHNHLYFVSKNDGTHIFTSTYRDHLKAVKFWQKTRRNRVGKSWRNLKQNKN